MNTQLPSRPAITQAMREQAAQQPNTWLYVVDPIFTDPRAEVPPWGFIGGYRVDPRGEITDDFSPNPHYRPSPVALRLPAPTNDAERALQLTTTGYAQGQMLLAALLDAELILFAQPQGNGLFTMDHESGRRQIQVFTSEPYLPTNWKTWQRMTGRQLAAFALAGMDIQINPGSPVKARIPGEDLIKAAATLAPRPAEQPPGETTAFHASVPESAPPPPPEPGIPEPTVAEPQAPEPPEPAPEPEPRPDPLRTEFGRRFIGALLAGAIGDALGATVESYPVDQIRSQYGESGLIDYDRGGERPGEFTDDTQMTLFTLEGLIRGHIATRTVGATGPLPAVQLAYQRWLHTQGYAWNRVAGPFAEHHPEPDGWLVSQRDLFAIRTPSSTCIAALREFASVGVPGTFERAINDSADNAGVVRAAPVALWSDDPGEVFELAAATAALTMSHPNGYLPAGTFAVLMHRLLRGEPMRDALAKARALLTGFAGHEDVDRLLQAAEDLAAQGTPTPEKLKDTLGGGWSAHEALAIAVCAALSTDGVAPAIITAVNHSGSSDATAAICGSIVGAAYGLESLPGVWLRDLSSRELVEELGKDALAEFSERPPTGNTWTQKYPAAYDTSDLVYTSTLPRAEPKPEPEPMAMPQPGIVQEPYEPVTEESWQAAGAVEDPEPVAEWPTHAAPTEEPAPEPVAAPAEEPLDHRSEKLLGCLLGGAIGDALGYAVKADSLQAIRERYGRLGVTDLVGSAISDNTQMTLFTLEGLIRASVRHRLYGEAEPATQVQYAYQRWLHTQGFEWKDAGGPIAGSPPDGWLIQQKGLFVRRRPGATTIQALHRYATSHTLGSFTDRRNDATGCGGVTRAAPTALWSDDPAEVFRLAAVTAALTHGHATGYLPAGALAVIVQQLLQGRSLPEAVDRALTELSTWDGHEETTSRLRLGIELATIGRPTPEQIGERLGDGRNGDSALAIAVCAALAFPESFTNAVLLAANHSGDSANTASICGNIMGAAQTTDQIPPRWLAKLELREVIDVLAQDAIAEFSNQPPAMLEWLERYPVRDPLPREDVRVAEQPAETADDVPESTEDAEPTWSVDSSVVETTPFEEVSFGAAPAVEEEDPVPAADPPPEDVEIDDPLSDEELRLLAAWRKFRDNDVDTPADLSDSLRRLLVEAFGEERAAQLVSLPDQRSEQAEPEEQIVYPPPLLSVEERLAGCVLGAAVGDALGAPWMFSPLATIQRNNPEGVREFAGFLGRRGTATAITQQIAFVLDGLIRARIRATMRGVGAHLPSMVRLSLEHWLCTQGADFDPTLPIGELIRSAVLREQRFPDEATVSALAQFSGRQELPTASNPPNSARTPIATARGAVIGFDAPTPEAAVALGAETAVITHGHPDGYLPAGALAGIIAGLVAGESISGAVQAALDGLAPMEGSETTAEALRSALDLSSHGPLSPTMLEKLGTGWTAPEALAIGVAAALSYPHNPTEAMSLAVTHSGNSAATAAICGSVVGAARGPEGLPPALRERLELREVLDRMLADSSRIGAEVLTDQQAPDWAKRYLE